MSIRHISELVGDIDDRLISEAGDVISDDNKNKIKAKSTPKMLWIRWSAAAAFIVMTAALSLMPWQTLGGKNITVPGADVTQTTSTSNSEDIEVNSDTDSDTKKYLNTHLEPSFYLDVQDTFLSISEIKDKITWMKYSFINDLEHTPFYKGNGFSYFITDKTRKEIAIFDIYPEAVHGDVLRIPGTIDGYTVTGWAFMHLYTDEKGVGQLCYASAGAANKENRDKLKEIKKIIMPATLVKIEQNVFKENYPLLADMEVEKGNPSFVSVDGVLFTADMKQLVHYGSGREETSYTVPDGVTSIWPYAFYCYSGSGHMGKLKTLRLPDTVKNSGKYSFYSDSINEIHIPCSLKSNWLDIDREGWLTNPEKVNIYYRGTEEQLNLLLGKPQNLILHFGNSETDTDHEKNDNKIETDISKYSNIADQSEPLKESSGFSYFITDEDKKEIAVFDIYSEAIKGEALCIPETIDGYTVTGWVYTHSRVDENGNIAKRVANYPLQIRYEIKKIIIPSTLVKIDKDVLSNIYLSFADIEVEKGNPSFVSVDGVLFTADMKQLVHYGLGRDESSYTVPDGVTGLWPDAFYSYTAESKLKTLRLPETLITTGEASLYSSYIKTIYIPCSLESNIGSDVKSWINNQDSVNIYYSGTEEKWNRISKILDNLIYHYEKTDTNQNDDTNKDESDSANSDIKKYCFITDQYESECKSSGFSYFFTDKEHKEIAIFDIYPEAMDGDVLRIPETIDGYTVTGWAYEHTWVEKDGGTLGSTANYITQPIVKKIIIPATMVKIEEYVFSNRYPQLADIEVENGNPAFVSVDGVLYTADMKQLVHYGSGREENSFTVPDGVSRIWAYAFYCYYSGFESKLNMLRMPDSVEVTGAYSLYSSTLCEIYVSSSLKQNWLGWDCDGWRHNPGKVNVYYERTEEQWNEIVGFNMSQNTIMHFGA